ncbi:MAG TPA: hypothetical protein DEP35_09330 [Deltaproteobacteria bacterium]|nr:hypothetical protein [Deltaproteobacteria bacterium]
MSVGSGARLFLAASLAIAAFSPAARGDDGAIPTEPRLRATGYLESDTAFRVESPRTFQKSQNRLFLDLEGRLTDSLRVRASGWLLYDPLAYLVGRGHEFPDKPVNRWQIGDSRHVEAELRELTLDWSGHVGPARVDVRLGEQQVVWGQSLGLRILDIVNAQDFREFILDDFNDARTPLVGLNVESWLAGWALQTLVFPTFEPNQLPATTSEFALNPLLPGFLPSFATIFAPPLVTPPFAVVNQQPEIKPPSWQLGTVAYGFRLARTVRGVDLGLYFLDAYDPAQTWDRRITFVPVAGLGTVPVNFLRAEHVRVRTLGGSFSTATGSFTIWGEGALAFGRSFVVDDLSNPNGFVQRSDLHTAIGVDWTGWDRLFANVQWIEEVVLGHEKAMTLDAWQTFFTLLLRFKLRNETVFPQLFVLYGVNEHDAIVEPTLEWKVTDRVALTAGLDLFSGPSAGLFGQYAHRNECQVVPTVLPVPEAGSCQPDVRPGRPSRIFLRLRYAFDFAK